MNAGIRAGRLTFVDVVKVAELPAVAVTLVTAATHPLCPSATVFGPLRLVIGPDLNVREPFGSDTLARVDEGLGRLGQSRSSQWEQRADGWRAWCGPDPSKWPVAAAHLDLLEQGQLP